MKFTHVSYGARLTHALTSTRANILLNL